MDIASSAINPTKEEKQWATLLHLSPLLGHWSLVGYVVPLVIWLMKKQDSPFIDMQGKEVLNFIISVCLWYMVAVFLIIFLIGLLFLWILPVIFTILSVIAAVKVSDGVPYRYPYILRLLK